MFLESLLFPDTVALGMTGGPRFATTVAPSPSGAEALMDHWPLELGAWDLVQANRTDAETAALLALFRLACGRAHGFRFHDPTDDTGTLELLGTGDGTTQTYQLVKHYDDGAFTYSRPILKPIAGSVLVYLDGVLTTTVLVSSSTGVVTLDPAPDADVLITASFRYHVPVRFDMDACAITCVEPGISTWSGMRLVELPRGPVDGSTTGEASADAAGGEAVNEGTGFLSAALASIGDSAGTGFMTTHYATVALHWIIPTFEGDDPVVSVHLRRSFVPDLPSTGAYYEIGPLLPEDSPYTENTIFGDYQGGASGVTLVPVGTPALDANVYEETLRGAGYNYQAIFTTLSAKIDASPILLVKHLTYPPTPPTGVTATFHDAGEFFSYVDFTYHRPASLHGNTVYFYFAETNTNGAGWVPYGGGLTGEFLGDTMDDISFTGNSGFADRSSEGTFAIRFKAQNDWGTSDWSEVASCIIPAYP